MIIQFLEGYNSINKKIEYEFELDKINYDGESIILLEPIKVKGNANITSDMLRLNLNIKTKIKLCCSRCLENFSSSIDIEIDEKFTNNKLKEEDNYDIVLIQGDKIDITETIVNNIISTLPIKRLCSENCKGLCQKCGTNLNKSNCNCDNGDVDIRLAKLKDLFS